MHNKDEWEDPGKWQSLDGDSAATTDPLPRDWTRISIGGAGGQGGAGGVDGGEPGGAGGMGGT